MLKVILPLLLGFLVLGVVFMVLTVFLEIDVKDELARRLHIEMPEQLPDDLAEAIE